MTHGVMNDDRRERPNIVNIGTEICLNSGH